MVVILDCNIWLSLAITYKLEYIDELDRHNISLPTCKELVKELTIVLHRPKFRKYFSEEVVGKTLRLHRLTTNMFILKEIKNVVADPKDNYLFALCEASNADYFVTGDKLLLEVGIYKNTKVISLSDFRIIIDGIPKK